MLPDNIIKDDQLFKLKLKVLGSVFRQILRIEPPKPKVGIFVSGNERLE